METKNCYDCELYPTCHARHQIGDLIGEFVTRFWLGLNVKIKVFEVIAIHCAYWVNDKEEE